MKKVPGMLLHAVSRISVRMLLFNILLVFLPIAGVYYLDTYEKQLLSALEDSLVVQGRTLAAALSGTADLVSDSSALLRNLRRRHDARIRIVDTGGFLVSDSISVPVPVIERKTASVQTDIRGSGPAPELIKRQETAHPEESFLYLAASWPVRTFRNLMKEPSAGMETAEYYSGASILYGAEIRSALSGRYGAATRISTGGQKSVTLYSAFPVFSGEAVIGAVLVSQSTYRILRDLYVLRIQIFKVFLISLSAALIISFITAKTVTSPIHRLRTRAVSLLKGKSRLSGLFRPSRRPDEIGDLQNALALLSDRIETRVQASESFAADTAHELKNPVASIRSSLEVALECSHAADPHDRDRFIRNALEETARLENLINAIRELSLLDGVLARNPGPPIDIRNAVHDVVRQYRERYPEYRFTVSDSGDIPMYVRIPEELFPVLLGNLLENAVSFSKPGDTVELLLSLDSVIKLEVLDTGKGIPAELTDKIFTRFFSLRNDEKKHHTGLGLSIVRSIAESSGGVVTAGNRSSGGAAFTVIFPAEPYHPRIL